MVKLKSTVIRIKDSRFVHLEYHLVSLKSDRNWSLGNGCLQLVWRLSLDIVDLGNLYLSLEGRSLALLILCSVWVVYLELLLIFFEIVHGILLKATIATL